ncbi:hypothetical protein OUZ56_012655 [Daphnia magna]|uniref:Uncharacterized protein n=1 Tax=Daphnia magna TaxID=35525 RepID=A0ABQ9Z3M8_9CRUS|nr:hypothetical protein OUZ56_012655 [Daphnia magna]
MDCYTHKTALVRTPYVGSQTNFNCQIKLTPQAIFEFNISEIRRLYGGKRPTFRNNKVKNTEDGKKEESGERALLFPQVFFVMLSLY